MKFLEVKDLNLVERLTVKNAFEKFIQHCTIKNLSKETIKFYKEKCNYFISSIKETYIDEITRRTIEDFVFYEKEKKQIYNKVKCYRIYDMGLFVACRRCISDYR